MATITVEFQRGGDLKREQVEADLAMTTARDLKAAILEVHGAGAAPIGEEFAAASDENRGLALVAFGRDGSVRHVTNPDEELRLSDYESFRVTTVDVLGAGGGRR
jgi:hypothetical protein